MCLNGIWGDGNGVNPTGMRFEVLTPCYRTRERADADGALEPFGKMAQQREGRDQAPLLGQMRDHNRVFFARSQSMFQLSLPVVESCLSIRIET